MLPCQVRADVELLVLASSPTEEPLHDVVAEVSKVSRHYPPVFMWHANLQELDDELARTNPRE